MAGSTLGNKFSITTWGESHGKALGVVVDGCPAGLPLNEDDVQVFLNRRRPGFSQFSTPRKESDSVEILSGVFEGRTTGTPISMIVKNTSQRSGDYGDIATYYRPGHADYTFDEKYGFRDYRGGGRSSGRETIGRVAAGAIASKILNSLGINITTYVASIGDVRVDEANIDLDYIDKNELNMPDPVACEKASELLSDCMAMNDSIGSSVRCLVKGMPAGIGETVFDKLDACLAKAVMSIGAVKAVEIGDGILASQSQGSHNNDAFVMNGDVVEKQTNHAGGILGGMSDGSDIILTAHFKPTPSIASVQDTVNKSGENIEVSIRGRHDPIIGPRAVVVVESMVAITILDLIFENMSSRMDRIIDFYKR
jgi:chorismate synthase